MSSCISILIILDILGLQIGWVIIVLISTGISQSNCRRHLRNITVRLGLTCKTLEPLYIKQPSLAFDINVAFFATLLSIESYLAASVFLVE